VVAHAFEDLRISVALWVAGATWYPIHVVPGVADFEYEHGVASRRWAYNFSCCERVTREKRTVRGCHAGFFDLFVPVRDDQGKQRGVFVAGPIARGQPTSADVLSRWNELTGGQGRLADSSFTHYVMTTLGTLMLDGTLFADFERLMTCFERLVSGRGDAGPLAARAEALRAKLMPARAAERMWEASRSLIDDRTSRTWPSHAQAALARLGMNRSPQHAIVGLLVDRRQEPDPLDALLRRHAFQRASVELAKKHGVVSGQVGDHGVVLLVDHQASSARVKAKLNDLAQRSSALARRFDFKLHAGIGLGAPGETLSVRYQSALWAAEEALSRGLNLVYGAPRARRSSENLRALRGGLAKIIGESATLLSPRFEQYIEAVLAHSGYRIDYARAQLEAGLERLAEPLLDGGLLDPRAWIDLSAAMDRTADEARTVNDLVAAYRRLASDLEHSMVGPTAGRQDRGLRRATTFIREHCGEALTLPQVARVAGFAPDYFSKLFQCAEGVTFSRYLADLRLSRAKQILVSTALTVEQVQKLAGYPTRTHFHRTFKRSVGITPTAYRELKPSIGSSGDPAD
jgi:AraC-like DNA-binding protein